MSLLMKDDDSFIVHSFHYRRQGWSPERSAGLGAGMLAAVLEVLPRLRSNP